MSQTFPSIKAALDYAQSTGDDVFVSVKQAAEQLTGGLGQLTTEEIFYLQESRKAAEFDRFVRSGRRFTRENVPGGIAAKVVRP